MPVDDILLDAEDQMQKAIDHLGAELRGVRTGRASPALVEHVKVDYYGSLTDIKAIAAISVPEATQIVIRPFSKADLKLIEKGISDSKLGLSAQSDGTQIRLNLPPMSMDRRKQMAGQVKEMGERAKIVMRNSRRDGMKLMDTEQKGGVIPEDDAKRGKEDLEKLMKDMESKIEEAVTKKTKEVMDV
jgi:ribosome recycling factor